MIREHALMYHEQRQNLFGAIAFGRVLFSPSIMMQPTQPSPLLDAALCDLLQHLQTFSDGHFNAEWMHLSEAELETLTVKLLQHWTETLDGKLLAGLLLLIRNDQEEVQT